MKNFSPRFIIIIVICIAMMTTLLVRLGTLTLAQGDDLVNEAYQRSTRSSVLKGTRGRILDRNGIVLAYDETCYDVQFLRDADNRSDYYSAAYTESLIKAIDIIEAGGGTVINTSYIQMDENGKLYYDWRVTVDNDDPEKAAAAKQAAITKRYSNFCAAMGFSVTDEILADPSLWKTPESAFIDMCKSWYIPAEMPFETAVKVISVRQEVNLNNYQAYEPITIAYNVSFSVAAELEARADELVGIHVTSSTTRIYPYGETAAHIVGYLQRSATEEMIESDGYSSNDYVGVSGVEKSMEKYLTGATTEHHGERLIKVNRNGKEIKELSVTPPTNGNTVMLTIDLPLQQKAEEALKNVIQVIHEKEERLIEEDLNSDSTRKSYHRYNEDTGEYELKDNIQLAETGAIVVLDVNNGQVLAMASYPSFDPNVFIQGLSPEQYDLLMGESAASTTPMRNKAVSERLAPGSTFKMVTAMASLMEGVITTDETIDDHSPYYLLDENGEPILSNPAHCWTRYPENHAGMNTVRAILNSCNYYFYEVSNRMGIDALNRWAENFGLNTLTGIEVTGEAQGIIGGQEVWFDNTLPLDEQQSFLPRYVYNVIREELAQYVKSYMPATTLNADSQEVKDAALELLKLQDGSVDGKGPSVRRILNEYLDIPEGIIKTEWVSKILSDLTELQWKDSQTIRTGIGQESILVTPVELARYVAAIANKGTVYDVHIVDSILNESGDVLMSVEPSIQNHINAPDEYWDAIHAGMASVVSFADGGTAGDAFSRVFIDAGYTDLMAGKTGSAQVAVKNELIDINNTSWFVIYTPVDNPEIAVVVCVPHGVSGASSVPAIEEIITYYYDRKDAAAPENLSDPNSLTP